jgi:hypothetical protein
MKKPRPGIRQELGRTVVLLCLSVTLAFGGERDDTAPRAAKERSDLTISNFFSNGWDEPWTKRARGEGTPDMSLLRVQTNFLAQLFRTDYLHQDDLDEASNRGSDLLSGTLEYAFSRRLMLALIGSYRWIDSRAGEDNEGAAPATFVRLQWIETATNSVATTFRVGLPNRDLGEKDTVFSLAIAGWRDLAPLGLHRVGLYYHLQEETLAGPGKPGSRRNDLTYAVSLAKSWTSPKSFIGNATTFVEAYGRTDLDGDKAGQTLMTLTPGLRATIANRHILMAGVEFPINDPQPYERILRLTYIFNF